MQKQVEIRMLLTIEVPDGMDVAVHAATVEARPRDAGDGTPAGGLSAVLAEIEAQAPRSTAPFQKQFVERCVEELEVLCSLPEGKRQSYVNAYPPRRFGSKRAASFLFSSGRVEIYCDPKNAGRSELADVFENNGVPVGAKLYLTSADAVQVAIELVRIGLDERDA